jgi:hypothetical protein
MQNPIFGTMPKLDKITPKEQTTETYFVDEIQATVTSYPHSFELTFSFQGKAIATSSWKHSLTHQEKFAGVQFEHNTAPNEKEIIYGFESMLQKYPSYIPASSCEIHVEYINKWTPPLVPKFPTKTIINYTPKPLS